MTEAFVDHLDGSLRHYRNWLEMMGYRIYRTMMYQANDSLKLKRISYVVDLLKYTAVLYMKKHQPLTSHEQLFAWIAGMEFD